MKTQAYLQTRNKSGLCPINIRYFHNTIFFNVGVGHSIRPEDFNKKSQIVLNTHDDHQIINYKITLIRNRMLQVAQEIQLKGFEPDRDIVKAAYLKSVETNPYPILNITNVNSLPTLEVIEIQSEKPKPEPIIKLAKNTINFDGLIDDIILHYHTFTNLANEWIDTQSNTTQRTKTQRRSWLKIMQEFSTTTKTSLSFDNFTLKFYSNYAQWLMHDSDHNLYNNSFGNNVKRLKTFLRWVELHKDITPNKQYKRFKVLTEEKQIQNAYLTPDEVNLLWEYKTFREHKEKTFERVIDLTVFQCLSGLRWSDMTFKSGLEVQVLNKQKLLVGKTQKSRYKQTYQIPLALDSRLELILKKYNYNLNLMSDVEYNRRIKEILNELYRKHKIHQQHYKIYRYKLDQQYVTEVFKSDLIASHSNRRAWVSWVYKELRLPEMLILRIMGSKSNEELKKYIGLNSEDILSAISAMNLDKEASPL